MVDDALPYNEDLRAVNVHIVDVPSDAMSAARKLYETAVTPHLNAEPGTRFSSGSAATFYTASPSRTAWGYTIKWIYGGDKETHAVFEDIFHRLNVRAHFQHADEDPVGFEINCSAGIRLYAGSFVVRTSQGLSTPFFHEDFNPRCGKRAYTFMSPLYDMSGMDDGHLLYHDVDGKECVCRYELGRSVNFGAGFSHATQPCSTSGVHTFLCFNYGTEDLGADWFDIVGLLPTAVLQLAKEMCLPIPDDFQLHTKFIRIFRRANKSGSQQLDQVEFEAYLRSSAIEAAEFLAMTDLTPYYVFEQLCGEATSMTEEEFIAAVSKSLVKPAEGHPAGGSAPYE